MSLADMLTPPQPIALSIGHADAQHANERKGSAAS
jgi:hypothetical protein